MRIEPQMNTDERRLRSGRFTRRSGYTLIEMLVVVAIVLTMMSLVMTSVSSMLQSTRMSRTLSLLVGAVDEARTNAVSYRRATKLDLTRIDKDGKLNRLTTSEPSFSDNFESYSNTDGAPPTPTPSNNGWMTTGQFHNNFTVPPPSYPSIAYDGSRCLRMEDGISYWNVCSHMDVAQQDNFEQIVMARVKFVPKLNRFATPQRNITVSACIQDLGGGTGGYIMTMKLVPSQNIQTLAMNGICTVTLSGGGSVLALGNAQLQVRVDDGSPAPTCLMIENVWYRVLLSVKRSTDISTGTPVATAIVGGKVWADGQLEPLAWTVGPAKDTSPLYNGPGGFGTQGGDALLDDVLIDGRPIRALPEGLRVDAIDPTLPQGSDPTSVAPVAEDSPYAFPIQFRPDGTTAQKYVIRLTDLSTGDRSYMTIDQNTGRTRTSIQIKDALK